MIHVLDKKLLRDFRRLWVQVIAIALVLGCGVAILLASFGMYRALGDTRTAYYERNRFADVFVDARRVPDTLLPELAAIEGIAALEARISGSAILDIPGYSKSAVGRILSLPESGDHILNAPILRSGSYPQPTASDQVLVNEPFALAHSFRTGDQFYANLNGTKRLLTISGTVLSPEFIYTIGPGGMMPDNETFGIIWMPKRAVAAAFDKTGAFNDLSVKLIPGARTQEVIDAIDTLLDPYGGLGAYDRTRHQSDSFVDAEITQLRSMSTVLPPIFFGISAFLVSMVMGRIVALERSEIGLLKAIGYSDLEISLHYQMLAGLVALTGIAIGWVAGTWLARMLSLSYAEFFHFPFLIFRVSPSTYAISGLLALVTTALGAARSALSAARLAPAVAMQPPAPPRFKRSFIDRLLDHLRLAQTTTMILRSFIRWPVRSALTALGLSCAVASVVAALYINDALDEIVDSAFYQSNRQDAMLLFAQDIPESALQNVKELPGVLSAEGQQFHAATLRNGHRNKTTAIEARPEYTDLSRVIDTSGNVVSVPSGGIVLSTRLAQHLDATIGDDIEVEFLSGRRETFELTVTGIITQYFGLGAYVDQTYLNQLFRQAPRISVANVLLDESKLDELHTAIKDIPKLTGTIMMTATRRSFQDTIRENIVVMNAVYITIAVLLTIGVAYNGARIQLSERSRELASLRILGFNRAEVSYVLVGESMMLAILAQPLGWLLGALISYAMSSGFSSDLYAIPLVLKPATFSVASLIVLGTSLAAVLLVKRRLDRINLISVMKTRE